MIYAKRNTITLSQVQQKRSGITAYRHSIDDIESLKTSIVVDMANDELNAVVNRKEQYFCLLTDTAFMKV